MFYLGKCNSIRDSSYLTTSEAMWVADAFMVLFVVDRISKGTGLLLVFADGEAGCEVWDIFKGLTKAAKVFTFSPCIKTTNFICITSMAWFIATAFRGAVVLTLNDPDHFHIKRGLTLASL